MSKALALVSFRDSKSLARGLGVQGVNCFWFLPEDSFRPSRRENARTWLES